MFGMSNLQPRHTGLALIVHVYKNEPPKARHAPRIKVYPGKPDEGNATTIQVPTSGEDESPEAVGAVTIFARDLKAAMAFVRRNYIPLNLFWYSMNFTIDDLRESLR